jgi:hypothetical protein
MATKLNLPKRISCSTFNTLELAAKILDKENEYENGEITDSDLEQMLYDEFEIDFENFHKLIEHILPYTCVDKSPLTGKFRIGLADHGTNCFIVVNNLELEQADPT